MNRRIRVLFFSEGVTASQVVRLVTLARALDTERFEVAFACSHFDDKFFEHSNFARHLVHSPDPASVLRAVKQGRRLYNQRELALQVKEDLRVFEATKPDLVVGDFRWSLCVSAKLLGVTHAALANAYWSPYLQRKSYPVPDHPLVGLLGEERTARYFPVALPRVFAWFAQPVNALRRKHGLPEIGGLPEVLTHGDYTLYADPAELVPVPNAPNNHLHLGYVPWAPHAALPPAITHKTKEGPLVYASLGSSGNVDVLPRVLEALSRLPVVGLIATAGRDAPRSLPPNVVVADFVPGDLAAREAAVVITNGGSSSSYQALAEGKPVLGLASNLDQFLAMEAVERERAGLLLRARSATSDTIANGLRTLLESDVYRAGATGVQHMISATNSSQRFVQFVLRATEPLRTGLRSSGVARVLTAVCVFVCAALLGSSSRAEPAAPAANSSVHFTTITNGRAGSVICALFTKENWLDKPVATASSAIRRRRATCVFESVPRGTYAVVAFHDENSNGDIDKNFLGLPTEDWCASRDAPAIFGPPLFDSAKFAVRAGVQQLGCAM